MRYERAAGGAWGACPLSAWRHRAAAVRARGGQPVSRLAAAGDGDAAAGGAALPGPDCPAVQAGRAISGS